MFELEWHTGYGYRTGISQRVTSLENIKLEGQQSD
jgi:hypothetical protein